MKFCNWTGYSRIWINHIYQFFKVNTISLTNEMPPSQIIPLFIKDLTNIVKKNNNFECLNLSVENVDLTA